MAVVVITGKPYQGKGAILGGYDRGTYWFSFTVKSNAYTQNEMKFSISTGGTERSLTLNSALVKITEKDSSNIVVTVNIEDPRVPRLINGDYPLKVAEVTSDHVWYRTK